jgi:lysophospholipase L1-like esterase
MALILGSISKFMTMSAVFLACVLIISIWLNSYLYQKGRDYFLQLNSTRLDPLGLSAYPITSRANTKQVEKPVILFFGDSRAAAWPSPDQITNANIINRGIRAQTTVQVLGRFTYHVVPLKPKIVIIQVGINDLKTIPLFPDQKETIVKNCKSNIQQIVNLSLENDSRVILTTIFPLGQLPIRRRPFWSDDVATAINDVNAFIGSLASDLVTVFDTGKVLANERGIIEPSYSWDFLHLNLKGYAALNRELIHLLLQ